MKLVSAIMPTRGRANTPWPKLAVSAFIKQTYTHKELLILDDADDPSFPDIPSWAPGVSYVRLSERLSIPEKRNKCCELVSGDFIYHADDDDWSAPTRMAEQVQRLEDSGLGLTGYHSALFINEAAQEAFRYKGWPQYAIGSSLCYLKSFWSEFNFPISARIGSDNQIVRHAAEQKQLISVDAGQMMVCRIHDSNTSSKRTDRGTEYKRVELSEIPAAFFA